MAKNKEALANKRKDQALALQYSAVNHVIDLSQNEQKKLRRLSADPKVEPILRPFREDMLKSLRENMTKLAKELENKDLTSFAAAHSHASMGDLFRNLGMNAEAVEQYQLAVDTAKQAADANPGEDRGRANLAVVLTRLGDMDTVRQGDLPAAREKYQKALALQEDVEANPRNLFYTAVDNKRLKANYLLKLGQVSVLAGDPAAARKLFEQAVEYRRAVFEANDKNNVAKSFLAEAYLMLADVCWRLSDVRAMDAAFKEGIGLCDQLQKANDKFVDYKADLAEANLLCAEANYRLGKYDEAKEHYETCRPLVAAAINKDRENLRYQDLVARLKYGQALTAEKLKDPEAAKHFATALEYREQYVAVDSDNLPVQTAYLLCLARTGKQAEAAKKADALQERVAKDPQLLIQLAGCYAVCAATTPDAAVKQSYTDKAIEVLRTTVKADYKDRVNLLTDPNLETLHDNAAFKEVVEKIKGQ